MTAEFLARWRQISSHWLVSLAMTGCVADAPRPFEGETTPSLTPGWNLVAGGPGTGCALDTPYEFYFRPGDPRRLAVYFQGGGACWNDATCDLSRRRIFDRQVDENDHPRRAAGIFDFSRDDNPLKDFSVLFVPYCTADAHLGSRSAVYRATGLEGAAASEFTIRHRGSDNARRALQWVYRQVDRPDLVLVAGGSAGAVATPYYVREISHRYPVARIVQIGDGAGGYRADSVPGIMKQWGATELVRRDVAFRNVEADALTFEALYIQSARATGNARYAQINTADDAVQLSFLRLVGIKDVPLPVLLSRNLADIRATDPGFRSYVAPGRMHTLLLRPEFYATRADAVALRDWVAALIEGRDVEDVGLTELPR